MLQQIKNAYSKLKEILGDESGTLLAVTAIKSYYATFFRECNIYTEKPLAIILDNENDFYKLSDILTIYKGNEPIISEDNKALLRRLAIYHDDLICVLHRSGKSYDEGVRKLVDIIKRATIDETSVYSEIVICFIEAIPSEFLDWFDVVHISSDQINDNLTVVMQEIQEICTHNGLYSIFKDPITYQNADSVFSIDYITAMSYLAYLLHNYFDDIYNKIYSEIYTNMKSWLSLSKQLHDKDMISSVFCKQLEEMISSKILQIKPKDDYQKTDKNTVYEDEYNFYISDSELKRICDTKPCTKYVSGVKHSLYENHILATEKSGGELKYVVKVTVGDGERIRFHILKKTEMKYLGFNITSESIKENNNEVENFIKDPSQLASISEKRFFIGRSIDTGKHIYLSENKDNRHFCITGNSGTGKSSYQQLQQIQMALQGYTVYALNLHKTFDSNNICSSFKEAYESISNRIDIKENGIPFNFWSVCDNLEEQNQDYEVTKILSMLQSLNSYGKKQKEKLYNAIVTAYKNRESSKKSLREILSDLNDDDLINLNLSILNQVTMGDPSQIQQGKINILDLSKYDFYSQEIIANLILGLIWNNIQENRNGQENVTKIQIFVDEFQNLKFNDTSPLTSIIREGRKLGIGLSLSTQTLSGFDKNKRDLINQSATMIYFRQTPDEARKIARRYFKSNMTKENQISQLKTGTFLAIGAIEAFEYTNSIEAPIEIILDARIN